MGCNQNEWGRFPIKQGNGVPTVPGTDDHQDGSWLTTDLYVGEWYLDLDTDKIYTRTLSGITEILDSTGAPVTIYTGDSSLPSGASRKFDLNTGKLFEFNGKVFFGTDDPEWFIPAFELPHLVQIKGDGTFGMIIANATTAGYTYSSADEGNGFLADFPGDGRAFIATLGDVNTFGFDIRASYNKLFDSNITPDPINEISSIFTVWSTRKGTIPFPRMTEAERDAITSPAIGLMVYVTDSSDGIYVYKSSGWTLVA